MTPQSWDDISPKLYNAGLARASNWLNSDYLWVDPMEKATRKLVSLPDCVVGLESLKCWKGDPYMLEFRNKIFDTVINHLQTNVLKNLDGKLAHPTWGNCPAFRSIRWWRIREFLTNEELLSSTSPTYQLLSNADTFKAPYVGSNPGMDFYSVFDKAMNTTRAQLVMWKHLSLFQMKTRKYAHVIRHYFLNNSYIRWASELQLQSIPIIYEVLRRQSEMEIETDYLSEMGMFELLAFKKQDKLDFRDVLEILRDKSISAEDRVLNRQSFRICPLRPHPQHNLSSLS